MKGRRFCADTASATSIAASDWTAAADRTEDSALQICGQDPDDHRYRRIYPYLGKLHPGCGRAFQPGYSGLDRAIKEYNKQNRPLLTYVCGDEARLTCVSSAITKDILREHLSVYFKYVDNDYKDLKRILGMDPLEITILKCGTFEEYERQNKEIRPERQSVLHTKSWSCLELQKEDYEMNRGWHF